MRGQERPKAEEIDNKVYFINMVYLRLRHPNVVVFQNFLQNLIIQMCPNFNESSSC